MKQISILAAGLLAISCSSPQEALTVKQFTLRDQATTVQGDPMVQNEKLRRLYGAVSLAERKDRLGQYYTVLWNADAGVEKEIVFRYQQGGSGSRIKEMRHKIPAGTSKGQGEFTVIGDEYFDNGRVLAWKIDLIAGGEIIASKQSYLWE